MKCPRCNFDDVVETDSIKRAGKKAYRCTNCDDVFLDHGEKSQLVAAEPERKHHRRHRGGPSFTIPRETGEKISRVPKQDLKLNVRMATRDDLDKLCDLPDGLGLVQEK